MLKWPSIKSLYNIRKTMKHCNTERKVLYRPKIKIDGTNGGVQISTSGDIQAQSRSRLISVDDDNHGFARWVGENAGYFSSLYGTNHYTIFGEWCGKGIQSGTAISQLNKKIFAVFAIQYGCDEEAKYDINPYTINKFLGDKPDDIFVLPFFDSEICIDYANKDDVILAADKLNDLVSLVEGNDPWVKDMFEIEGIGEGMVLYPLPDSVKYDDYIMVSRNDYGNLVFKAKGEKHKVVKTKKSVQVDPEVAKNVDDFVALFATETRLKQWAGDFNVEQTGKFIKDFSIDIKKESIDELEASGLTWKQVAKPLSTVARNWFIDKCKET